MNRYEQRLAELNQALLLNPLDARTLAQRAETYRLMACYQAALTDFTQALELMPTYAWALAHRGETYRLLLADRAALADFDQALALQPTYAWALAHRGAVYRMCQEYEKAIADFSQAITLAPTYAWAFAYRARTYELLRCYTKTLADFDQAIALDATLFADWRIKRGMMLSFLGRYAEAVIWCEQLLQETPDDPIALYNLAVFKVHGCGLSAAQLDLQNARTAIVAMGSAQTGGMMLYRLGGLAAVQGDSEQALAYLKEAVALAPVEVIDYATHDVAWLALRHEPRFQALLIDGQHEFFAN